MLRGIQAGFGASIAADLPALRSLGVELVRLDCTGLDAGTTQALVREPIDSGLVPFPIVSSADQLALLPAGTNVELLNEPDLNGPSPAAYEGLVGDVGTVCAQRGLTLWAGAVSNLNRRGVAYLRDAGVMRWPSGVCVSVHRYPTGQSPLVPHDGFASRDAEVLALRVLIGARPWGVSEFGYHGGNRATWWQRLFGIRRQWTDGQVRTFTAWEWEFWQKSGAAGAVLYQLNDGPTSSAVDRYGIRRTDGTWKPSASTFQMAVP